MNSDDGEFIILANSVQISSLVLQVILSFVFSNLIAFLTTAARKPKQSIIKPLSAPTSSSFTSSSYSQKFEVIVNIVVHCLPFPFSDQIFSCELQTKDLI